MKLTCAHVTSMCKALGAEHVGFKAGAAGICKVVKMLTTNLSGIEISKLKELDYFGNFKAHRADLNASELSFCSTFLCFGQCVLYCLVRAVASVLEITFLKWRSKGHLIRMEFN